MMSYSYMLHKSARHQITTIGASLLLSSIFLKGMYLKTMKKHTTYGCQIVVQ